MPPVFAVTAEGFVVAMLVVGYCVISMIVGLGRAAGKVPGGQQAAGAVVKHFFGGS
jgi:hypothetical protein